MLSLLTAFIYLFRLSFTNWRTLYLLICICSETTLVVTAPRIFIPIQVSQLRVLCTYNQCLDGAFAKKSCRVLDGAPECLEHYGMSWAHLWSWSTLLQMTFEGLELARLADLPADATNESACAAQWLHGQKASSRQSCEAVKAASRRRTLTKVFQYSLLFFNDLSNFPPVPYAVETDRISLCTSFKGTSCLRDSDPAWACWCSYAEFRLMSPQEWDTYCQLNWGKKKRSRWSSV